LITRVSWGLKIEAPTENSVLIDALKVFGEPAGEDRAVDHVTREGRLKGPERPMLLMDWLEELVPLAETESVVPEEVSQLELSDRGVIATGQCHLGSPAIWSRPRPNIGSPLSGSRGGSVRQWCSIAPAA